MDLTRWSRSGQGAHWRDAVGYGRFAHAPTGKMQVDSATDIAALIALEEPLWRAETRFDRALMEQTFAPEFFEFGRSGRVWSRQECLDAPPQPFESRLEQLAVRFVSSDVALVSYVSIATFDGVEERGNRSSLWRRSGATWQLVFHQGTPVA